MLCKPCLAPSSAACELDSDECALRAAAIKAGSCLCKCRHVGAMLLAEPVMAFIWACSQPPCRSDMTSTCSATCTWEKQVKWNWSTICYVGMTFLGPDRTALANQFVVLQRHATTGMTKVVTVKRKLSLNMYQHGPPSKPCTNLRRPGDLTQIFCLHTCARWLLPEGFSMLSCWNKLVATHGKSNAVWSSAA